jgi:hypothetical protein
MGLKCSPDFAQEVMENILRDISEAEVYIDDIGFFTKTWEEHMKVLRIVQQKLQDNGFTINPLGDCIYSSKWFIPHLGQSKMLSRSGQTTK